MAGSPDQLRVIPDSVCTACGCLCDDIELSIDAGRVVQAAHACQLAESRLYAAATDGGPAATIDGREATIDEGIEEAAQLLAAAQNPLIYGLSRTTCDAQRLATAIADWTGATIDSPSSEFPGISGMTFAGVGEMTCTLGEVRHRGDLVIFWGADPASTHPRLMERYALDPLGMFVPGGRRGRTCIVIDSQRSETAAHADLFIEIAPGRDFEALWVVRALVKGLTLDADQVTADTGCPLDVWQNLVARMRRAHFGVLFTGAGLAKSSSGYLGGEAALALVRDLNSVTRFVCVALRPDGNSSGADDVLLWTTGYPSAVNFARGYPRYNPGEFSAAALVARGEVDAVLLIGVDDPRKQGDAARWHLSAIPVITLDSYAPTQCSGQPHIAFRTARPGLSIPGTMYRLDDVPLPLRPAIASHYPADAEILARLEARIKQLRGYGPAIPRRERSRLV